MTLTETQSEATNTVAVVDESALTDAVRQLAASMGIDAEPTLDAPWPIDVGQRSVTASFEGVTSGSVFLSLVEADVDRLVEDAEGAEGVLRDIVASIGIDPEATQLAAFRPADGLPEMHVVARGGEKVVAIGVSITQPEAEVVADVTPPATAAAASFEPEAMASTNNQIVSAMAAATPISLLSDVDMQVTVELGRTKLPVRELLSLQPGMVVELDRQAGAPIDVLVNGHLIARGEVVVLDEQFGLRITEIISDSGAR